MNDKTLGVYKRTTPDPDETTGEALARLQAEMTRLLDEADGGVTAALIEKEVEQPDAEVRELRSALARELARGNALQDALAAAESRPLTPDAITDEMVRRGAQAETPAGTRYLRPHEVLEVLTAALTEPTRPKGAEKVEAVLHQYWSGDIDGDDLADRIAEEMNR